MIHFKYLILVFFCTSCFLFPKPVMSQNTRVETSVVGISSEIIGLNDMVRLRVKNYDSLFSKSKRLSKKIILYLNDLPVNDIRIINMEGDSVKFYLKRGNKSKETWMALVNNKKDIYSATVSVSIGLEDENAVITNVDDVELEFVRRLWLWACFISSLILLGAFIALARNTNIIRDSGPKPDKPFLKPYSIGKSQMAFWFFLIVVTYPILWIITGEASEITGSILVLLGISSATALGATAIDTNKISQLQEKMGNADQGELPLDERIKKTEELIENATKKDQKLEIDNLTARLGDLKSKKNEIIKLNKYNTSMVKGRKSKSFFKDVLSDDTGFSFHRFQIMVWTLVLGGIFIIEVLTNLQMPQFDDTTLALMGISSGTYIGFKFPEKQPADEE